MAAADWMGPVGVWVAVGTGIVTGLAALFGLYREWWTFRQRQADRLLDAATVAVRRAEATIVRPLLRQRLTEALGRAVEDYRHLDALRFRVLLFRDLQCALYLTDGEKRLANDTAVNLLVAQLRAMPSPPLRVDSDRDTARANRRLRELVETTYSLRRRPNVDMLQQLAYFCGNTPTSPQLGQQCVGHGVG